MGARAARMRSERASAAAAAPVAHAASSSAAATAVLSNGASARSAAAPEPAKSRRVTLAVLAHARAVAFAGSVGGASRGSGVRASAGLRASVSDASESLTSAESRPRSDMERTDHDPEHPHAAPRTPTVRAARGRFAELDTESTANPSHVTPVSATVRPPAESFWSGTATVR